MSIPARVRRINEGNCFNRDSDARDSRASSGCRLLSRSRGGAPPRCVSGTRGVQALFAVLVPLCLQVEGFRNRQLRPLLARMLGLEPGALKPGKISYELRLRGLIERIGNTHRYRLTGEGLRTYARGVRRAHV